MKALAGIFLLCTATLLGGCASVGSVSSEVSSFGDWPAGRQPGSYAFERLPSQQARPAESDLLEASARGALAKAGFTPVDAGKPPDVLVQVGLIDSPIAQPPWDEPIWWRGGFGWPRGPWGSLGWSGCCWDGHAYYGGRRYALQVAVLIRDRASGKPLYESHASTDSLARADPPLLAALFDAALIDFPRQGMNPRRVVVPLAP